MPKPTDFISHWSKLIENFQASSLEFYNAFEQAVGTRNVPELHSARVEHKEGGLASGNRQYLRLHRGKHAFDICAAPFGTGFFVSWWFTEPPLRFGFLYTIACFLAVGFLINFMSVLGFAAGAIVAGLRFAGFFGICFAGLGVPGILWLTGYALRTGRLGGESTVLAMPLIGWMYASLFAPPTFYSTDTGIMFQQAVHNAVLEVVDCMTANKGIRTLTEAERQPTMKRFAATV